MDVDNPDPATTTALGDDSTDADDVDPTPLSGGIKNDQGLPVAGNEGHGQTG